MKNGLEEEKLLYILYVQNIYSETPKIDAFSSCEHK